MDNYAPKYPKFTDVYYAGLRHILYHGALSAPRGMIQREVVNFSYTVTQNANNGHLLRTTHERQPNYEYGEAFADFVLSGKKRIPKSLIEMNPAAKFFKADSLKDVKAFDLPKNFSVFYGPRIHAQLDNVIAELNEDPDTRRAYVSVLDGINDNKMLAALRSKELDDVEYPCTVGFHFLKRDGKLSVTIQMRSQNMVSVWPYDYLIANRFLKHVAKATNSQVGDVHGQVSSAHIYERDFKVVNEMLKSYFG